MVHRMSRLVALVLTLLLCSCSFLSSAFRDNLRKFVEQGSRLAALTEQGVSFDRFGDQLASATATYDLLDSTWPKHYKPDAKKEFGEAVIGWKLVHQLWSMHNRSDRQGVFDHELRQLVDSYAPGRVPQDPNNVDVVDYMRAARVLMAVASEHFQQGRSAVVRDI
jgi:hypothetical protein